MDNKKNEFLKVYNEFCEREYEDESLKKIPEDGIFGIAYTTGDEKEKYTLQLDYDINHEEYIFSINDEIICKEYTPISEVIEEIEMGTFEGYYDYMLDKAEEHGITFDEVEKIPFELWLDRDDASVFKSEYECFIKAKINTSMYLMHLIEVYIPNQKLLVFIRKHRRNYMEIVIILVFCIIIILN